MNRTEIINYLIKKNDYKSYLEIGINAGLNYQNIACESKTGVDPDRSAYHYFSTKKITSDEFFYDLEINTKFDIIFIDGLHLEHQVDKDIENSFLHLSSNGTVVLHDCNPPTIHHARENFYDRSTPAAGKWNGTVWRSLVKVRCTREDLTTCVVDSDWGCGIIQQKISKVFNDISLDECLKWETFDKNRRNILNLISLQQFLALY